MVLIFKVSIGCCKSIKVSGNRLFPEWMSWSTYCLHIIKLIKLEGQSVTCPHSSS